MNVKFPCEKFGASDSVVTSRISTLCWANLDSKKDLLMKVWKHSEFNSIFPSTSHEDALGNGSVAALLTLNRISTRKKVTRFTFQPLYPRYE